MIIGLDYDNTLVDTSYNTIALAEENLGIKAPSYNHDWCFSGFPKPLVDEITRLFKDDSFMNNVFTFRTVVPTLYKWKKAGHKIIIITARAPEVRKGTRQMVKRIFPMVDKLLFVDMGQSKSEIMKKEKLDIWIDDAPHGVLQSKELGIKTYLIHNKYTKCYNSEVAKKHRDIRKVKVISDINLEDK